MLKKRVGDPLGTVTEISLSGRVETDKGFRTFEKGFKKGDVLIAGEDGKPKVKPKVRAKNTKTKKVETDPDNTDKTDPDNTDKTDPDNTDKTDPDNTDKTGTGE